VTEDLRLRVITDGDTRGLDKTARGLDDVADEADRAGKSTEKLGDKSRKTEHDVVSLDSRIGQLKASLQKLSAEVERSGGSDKSLLKQFRADSKEMAGLEKLKKTIDSLTESGGKGFDLAGAGIPGLSALAKSPALATAGAAIGTALAVPLLATLGGAITAGGGATIAGLGIAGAVLGDPEHFKAAWGHVLDDLKKQFVEASTPFAGPTMDALRTIGPLVRSWHIDQIFANAARFVEPLVHGIGGAGTGLMKGIGDIVKEGGPAVEALSDGLVRLGEAGGNALSSIAGGAEGGATALHDMVTVISLVIEGFGKVIEGAENAYQFMHDHPWMTAAYTGGLSLAIAYVGELDDVSSRFGTTELGLRKAAEEAGHAFTEQGEDITALMQQLNAAKVSVDSYAAAIVNKLFSATMGLDQATLRFKESLTQLSETFNRHDHSIDTNTKKGQENVAAIYSAVTANQELYQRMVAAGSTAEQAAAAYDKNTQALETQLYKAGLTSQQIDGLIGKYRNVPDKVNTDIAMHGLESALNGLEDVLRLINGLPPRKDIYVYTHTGIVGGKEGPGLYASGTRSAPPGLAWVGEEGPELVKLRGGEQIFPAAQSAIMAGSNASMTGGGSGQLSMVFGGNTDSVFASAFMRLVREGMITIT
jgi:ABC-type transporter Mla subunit MlaD